MKITKQIIKDLEKALDTRKKDGTPIWDDGDEIEVCVAGTFVADKFITVLNRTKTLRVYVIKRWFTHTAITL